METITQIIERTRISQGYEQAEAKAKEIRELIENGLSETDLFQKLKASEIYFGFFKGMDHYGKCYEDFDAYKKIKNKLPKKDILAYLKQLPIADVAPMTTKDIFTGERLVQAGIYKDGPFTFPIDFIHYYKKYDIGIPIEYEKYIKKKI